MAFRTRPPVPFPLLVRSNGGRPDLNVPRPCRVVSWVLTLALAAATVSAVTPAPTAHAASGGTVVFFNTVALDPDLGVYGYQIWTMNPDGSGKRAIVTDPYQQPYSAAVNPAGNKVAFTTGGRTLPQSGLFVINLDGSGRRNVLRGRAAIKAARNPTWSPDGRQLAFIGADSDYQFDVWVINVDGTGLRRVTRCDCDGNFITPKWNPRNARQMLWSPNGYDLAVLDPVSGASKQIYDNSQSGRFNIVDYSWSPDGQSVAVSGSPWNDGSTNVSVMNADGSGLVTVADDPERFYTEPVWSPDGASIAVTSGRADVALNEDTERDVLVMNAQRGTAGPVSVLPMLGPQAVAAWSKPCSRRCSPGGRESSITVNLRQEQHRYVAEGGVIPFVPGKTVAVTLQRKRGDRWVDVRRVTTKVTQIGTYSVGVRRANSALCRINARFTGTSRYDASTIRTKPFGC